MRRWVFAVPQVWHDAGDGVIYGRVLFARRPSGEPVFDVPQQLSTPAVPTVDTPGYLLLRLLAGDQDGFVVALPLPARR